MWIYKNSPLFLDFYSLIILMLKLEFAIVLLILVTSLLKNLLYKLKV
jgi:hypothetical protein